MPGADWCQDPRTSQRCSVPSSSVFETACTLMSLHDMRLLPISRRVAGIGEDGYYSPRSESVGEMSAWGISERQGSAPDLDAVSIPAGSSPSASPVQVGPWRSSLMAQAGFSCGFIGPGKQDMLPAALSNGLHGLHPRHISCCSIRYVPCSRERIASLASMLTRFPSCITTLTIT